MDAGQRVGCLVSVHIKHHDGRGYCGAATKSFADPNLLTGQAPDCNTCYRAHAVEQQVAQSLQRARRTKRAAESLTVKRRMASAIACLEDALDRLRGGE